ncbi:MAG: hypothetical protein WCY32_10430 [Burkholderiaceae bacterium]
MLLPVPLSPRIAALKGFDQRAYMLARTVNLAKHGVSLALAAKIEWESAIV